jgi:hypothetical protein
MEGHWRGCENAWLHDKVISDSLGGIVIGASKVLTKDGLWFRDYFEIRPAGGSNATLTFYTGTAIKAAAQCTVAPQSLDCRTPDGSFSNIISFVKGPSHDKDALRMVKTIQGATTSFDLQRADDSVPACD